MKSATINKVKNLLLLMLLPYIASSQITDSTKSAYDYSLKELTRIKISTGLIKNSSINTAPANIIIIPKNVIEERAYQTLVDVCQDIPGFDFIMYNDGGGEYPGFSKNRGIGEVGNPEILIMVDGIVQNNINFNWSQLWTYENIFVDVEQIEIVQGPGSVIYGAQAFTGVINIITKKNFTGVKTISSYGSDDTWQNDLHLGANLTDDIHLSIALHQYHTQGDMGIGRYDPGKYFSNNMFPDTILYDYDTNGNFVQNIPNPKAGTIIPEGFNTLNNSYAIRSSISYKNNKLGVFLSEYEKGGTSAYLPYEYLVTDKECLNHYRSMHLYLQNSTEINPKLSLNSQVVYRNTHILPKTGFKYIYQFPELSKNYTSYAYQTYIEEKLLFSFEPRTTFCLGLKATYSIKSNRIISLGVYDDSKNSTSSSWDIAKEGKGINQTKVYPTFYEKEFATYGILDKQWLEEINSTVGIRYDYSSNYGSILNPRLSLLLKPKHYFGAKLLYGTAFRQPGIFELKSEFRGNPNLIPEKIKTSELELNAMLLKDQVSVKTNIFYSTINDYIGKMQDSTMPAGERYENHDKFNLAGFSAEIAIQAFKNIRLYANYGSVLNIENSSFHQIENTAKDKINAGINSRLLKNKLIADFRMNWVGKRKASITNRWIHQYLDGYTPSYFKANFSITYLLFEKFKFQLSAKNVFNEKYYGIGRETGNAFIDDYDPAYNVNPEGFLPAYHPQPGRTFLASIIFELNK